MVKTYVLAPNFATAPDGAIKLGHVLKNLTEFVAVNRNSIVPISNPNPVDIKDGFTATRAKLLSGELGFFAKVLALVGIGVGASIFYHKSSSDVLSFAKLVTVTFDPTDDYIAETMKLADINIFLANTEYKKPLYLITGLKIGQQGSMQSMTTTAIGGGAEAAAGPPGLPVEAGARLNVARATQEGIAFTNSTDFIVAFRVRKVTFKHGEPRHQAYDSKAVMQGKDGDEIRSTVTFEVSDDVSLGDLSLRAQRSMHEENAGRDDADVDDEETLWILPNVTESETTTEMD
ncbi:hypothetical protein NKR23_g10838 [Pleurostoma richardsiae]|uniref:Uncharacterized protein n=1 Tax=Pleurostoma richardsiae TaxID=41990 RepID=A0AA38VHM1_9PEZI|nr:hypothetical protein NKR23_g10838 [Pleurostoma richardsiae]